IVPAPYSAMTVVPCANAIGFANVVDVTTPSANAPVIFNRFMTNPPNDDDRKQPARAHATPAVDGLSQRIGGGLRGGSSMAPAVSTSLVTGAAVVFAISGRSSDGMAPTWAVHAARHDAWVPAPSGQQGQPSACCVADMCPAHSIVSASLAGTAASAFTTGADNRSCAATSR